MTEGPKRNLPDRPPASAVRLGENAANLAARMQRLAEEREAQAEAARVYQLALWPDDKRAMPLDFVACALFAAVQGKNAPYLRGEQIASVNGFTITFTGKRLTQVHADILMGVAYLARSEQQGHIARFRDRAFLRLIGREPGTNSYKSLRQLIDDLIATSVRITDASGKVSYSSSILTRSADRVDEEEESTFSVEITRDFCKLFERGFAQVDWKQRLKLLKKPLALWLQVYFSQFHKPVAVAELHRLCGSEDALRFFRRRLRRELEVLQEVGVIAAWFVDDDDVVHVAPAGQPLPARFRSGSAEELSDASNAVASSQTALPLPATLPQVSQRALDAFCKRYEREPEDARRCLADWHTWLRQRGFTADKPDAAFTGFAKRWIAGKT